MKIVPVLKKEKFEDAKEILDKEKINYKEEKEFSLLEEEELLELNQKREAR